MAVAIDEEVYRASKSMNYRLQESANIYLQHRQYVDGFDLISSTLIAGGSTTNSVSSLAPSYRPTSQHLALAATLIVHPQFTIRARKAEDSQASDAAYQLLKSTITTFGTINSGIADAFVFGSKRPPRRKGPPQYKSEWQHNFPPIESSEEDNFLGAKLESKFAEQASVFAQVEHVWHLVGWAFNCAFKYPKRWQRWKLFLDVLFEIWERNIVEAGIRPNSLEKSLAMKVLETAEKATEQRAIFRAIFADGGPKSLAEFTEVFKDETKEQKVKEEDPLARQKLNLDEDKWADYNAEDDDVVMEDASNASDSEDEDIFVLAEVSELRVRLFKIMTQVATVPGNRFTHLSGVYDRMTEFFRPLPFGIFRQLVLALKFNPRDQAAFLANAILPFLVHFPANIDVENLTQSDLVKYFIPFRANSASVIESAKMSILIERLLMTFGAENRLEITEQFVHEVQDGIQARELYAIGDDDHHYDGRRVGTSRTREEEECEDELRNSGRRINAYILMLQARARSLPALNLRSSSPLSSIDARSTPARDTPGG